MKNILSKSVLDLDPKIYSVSLFISVTATIVFTVLYLVSFDWNNNVWMFALGGTGFFFFISFVILIMRYASCFEWLIDIVLVLVAVGHILTLLSPDLAGIYWSIPVLNFLLNLLIPFIFFGAWIIFYPYLFYRLSKRYKSLKKV